MKIDDREKLAKRLSRLSFPELVQVDGQGDVHIQAWIDNAAYGETLIRVLLMDLGRYEAFARFVVQVREEARAKLAERHRTAQMVQDMFAPSLPIKVIP